MRLYVILAFISLSALHSYAQSGENKSVRDKLLNLHSGNFDCLEVYAASYYTYQAPKTHGIAMGIGFTHRDRIKSLMDFIFAVSGVSFRIQHDYNYHYEFVTKRNGMLTNHNISYAGFSFNLNNQLHFASNKVQYAISPQLGFNAYVLSVYAGPKFNLVRTTQQQPMNFYLTVGLQIPFYSDGWF